MNRESRSNAIAGMGACKSKMSKRKRGNKKNRRHRCKEDVQTIKERYTAHCTQKAFAPIPRPQKKDKT